MTSMNDNPIAFRPRPWRRTVTCVGPFLLPLALGFLDSSKFGLSGEELYFVIGMGCVAAVAVVGITVGPDTVVIVNAFETIRIPAEKLESFLWEDYGLSVVWDGGGHLRFTPVQAFHRLRNPMADLAHGLEVWERLTALTSEARAETPVQGRP